MTRFQLATSSASTRWTRARHRPPSSIQGTSHPDTAGGVYPDGRVVRAGRIRHEDEGISGAQAVDGFHPSAKNGAVDGAVELLDGRMRVGGVRSHALTPGGGPAPMYLPSARWRTRGARSS